MSVPGEYPFARYLAAKKPVDDRSLNAYVFETLRANLHPADPAVPLRVLEVGAGIGTMVERLVERAVLGRADYTAVDSVAENVHALGERLPRWARAQGWDVPYRTRRIAEGVEQREVAISMPGGRLAVRAEAADLFAFAAAARGGEPYDLLVANAVLDLVDARAALAALLPLLRPGGLAWLTVNYDGVTVLEPAVDPELDALLPALYAASLDGPRHGGQPPGDRHAGRHLFGHLRALGAHVLAAGSSDWVLHPVANGYAGDEAYFLHWLVHQFTLVLADDPRVPAARLADWVARRHAQIETAELLYVAHQIDYLARVARAESL